MQKLAFSLVLFFSMSCGSPSVKNSDKLLSLAAHFSINHRSVSYVVNITGDKLVYIEKKHRGNSKSNIYKLQISDDNLRELEKKFLSAGANRWKKVYANPPRSAGGTNWVIQYKSDRLNINSKGKNNYPKSFNEITSYISTDLLNGKPFR